MSISLEQLAQILASVRISSSCEEEILIAAKSLNTPLEENNELTFEESSCISNDEQLFEQENEEDEEKLQHDLNQSGNHAYESLIERWFQWFQTSTRLDRFCFYFIRSYSQKLDSIILVYFHFKIEKLKMNIFLLLLREWLHWKSNYT